MYSLKGIAKVSTVSASQARPSLALPQRLCVFQQKDEGERIEWILDWMCDREPRPWTEPDCAQVQTPQPTVKCNKLVQDKITLSRAERPHLTRWLGQETSGSALKRSNRDLPQTESSIKSLDDAMFKHYLALTLLQDSPLLGCSCFSHLPQSSLVSGPYRCEPEWLQGQESHSGAPVTVRAKHS